MADESDDYTIKIDIDRLRALCNPWNGCWMDIDRPIQMDEVMECLEQGEECLTDTEFKIWLYPSPDARQKHIQKIAYFARHGFQQPLLIDVGMPEMGCHVSYIIDDGNHRFAAAIYRKERMGIDVNEVPVNLCGSHDYAAEIGLIGEDDLCETNRM